MTMYFFLVTVRVQHDQRLMDVQLFKAARADSELTARRQILNCFFRSGFQVKALVRAQERTTGSPGND